MRLHQARLFLWDLASKFHDKGNRMTLIDAEYVGWILDDVSFTLRRLAIDIKVKGQHFHKIPYIVSEAEDKDVAKLCVDQLKSLPDDVLAREPLLRSYKNTLLPLLAACMLFV